MLPLVSMYLLTAEYAFMGSLIILEVIKDLTIKGIKQAKVVMLAGTRWVCFTALRFDADHSFRTRARRLCTIWTISMPSVKQGKFYFRLTILSTIYCRCFQSTVNNDIMFIKGPCLVMVNIPLGLATYRRYWDTHKSEKDPWVNAKQINLDFPSIRWHELLL